MTLTIPELSLVVLIGPSGSGKSTFAHRHFKPTEILSSDTCRGLVSDNENSQEASADAFEVLHMIAAKRLARGLLTVIDATNVQADSRRPLVAIAREFHCLPVAIVLDLPEKLCHERNQSRPDRQFGLHVVRAHTLQLRKSLRTLTREGFRHTHILRSQEEIEAVTFERQPLWCNRKGETGPFDIIGDIHGCLDELTALLTQLGYSAEASSAWTHPQGRKLIFLGDLVDRGPDSPGVVRLVRACVQAQTALAVPGNHDLKFVKKIAGHDVRITHGLAETLAQFADAEQAEPGLSQASADFLKGLVSHYVLDGGSLVVAHAGMKASMQGRGSGRVREFALYGETTGETDEFGLPVRYNWAAEYRGRARVVYGHTPVPEPVWLNNTINIDTGCVFGGRLTALRYPEMEMVSVPARHTYAEPARPFLPDQSAPASASTAHTPDDIPNLNDILGKRVILTRLLGNVTVREENSAAALEVMSRFAANPRWLIHLPPTMSPCATSALEGLLEHPAEAFAYYRDEGIPRVVCQLKHMGSRSLLILCRDQETVRRRFGIPDSDGEACGTILTRTGRRFFDDPTTHNGLITHLRSVLDAADFWNRFHTDWVLLDAELMPWSAKAAGLIRSQYAAVASAGRMALDQAICELNLVADRGHEFAALAQRFGEKRGDLAAYTSAFRHYVWRTEGLQGLQLAAFHLLATEGQVHVTRDHAWHMETLAALAAFDPQGLLIPTPWQIVDLLDDASTTQAIDWWQESTSSGCEGMVVKPLEFIASGRRRLAQPAVKCRGREYLRIIYGPEYTQPQNLERLRKRSLSTKRSLALREFALGIEALERFVRHEPFHRVHECVFGIFAMESEPVDPRL